MDFGAIDGSLSLLGLVAGVVIGLTGMGGGAILTPALVLFFGVSPATAVSSDLVASLVLKPLGAAVHSRERTVNWWLVRWLCVGSVPSAFAGAMAFHWLGQSKSVDEILRTVIGVALLLACLAMGLKATLSRRPAAARVPGGDSPFSTVAIGVVGGFLVGMTSVGSGSLMIVLLMLLHPRLRAAELVGTDLTQAFPLVAAAALAHWFVGSVNLELTASLLVGSVPGVVIGARLSSRGPDAWVRPVLFVVLLSTASKLLGVPTPAVLAIAIVSTLSLAIAGVMRGRAARGSVVEPATSEASAGSQELVLVDTPVASPSVRPAAG